MNRKTSAALSALMMLTAVALSCTDIPTGTDKILSFTVNPLPSPSVVVGDSLRDTLGIVRPITVTAFTFQGDTAASSAVRFFAGSRGIRVDSLSGIVRGDSVQTSAKVIVAIGSIQAQVLLGVALRPDSITGVNSRDSLSYSLTDTTQNTSPALSVKVLHGTGADSAVVSYRVSFRIVSPSGTVAQLVNDAGVPGTTADTTDVSGIASRRVKINVSRLVQATDSVVVMASASYRGAALRGSPVRLVLKYKLKSP